MTSPISPAGPASRPNHATCQTDEILDQLRPRMRAARISHVRRLLATLAVVPLVGFAAAAMAASGIDAPTIETAAPTGAAEPAPNPTLPDIGGAAGNDAPLEPSGSNDDADGSADLATTTTTTSTTSPTLAADRGARVIDLGALGSTEIERLADGTFSLLNTDLVSGWELVEVEFVDGKLIIVVSNGNRIATITVRPGVRDEISVNIDEAVVPPPTTTVKPRPTPPPVVVDRIVVEVPGKGSFVVERDGPTLFLGNVQANDGFTAEVISAEGPKVYVGFTDGSWIWYGKALINDVGKIEKYFWDEAVLVDAVYQWVEIPGVGAAKFKLYDARIWVKEVVPANGFGGWDHNQGEPGLSGRVEFEGQGAIWYIDMWINEAGEMAWSTTDASSSPSTTTTVLPPTSTAP